MVARTVGRMIWVPCAFILAAFSGLAVLLTLGAERLVHQAHAISGSPSDQVDIMVGWLDQGVFLFSVVSALTLLPAVLLVIVGEVGRIRSLIYYVLGGGIAMVAVPLATRFHERSDLPLPPATLLQLLATAGFAAGLVYWLLAGRRA